MFNSTHTLTGFALARTGIDGWVPYATATAVIASNLPDIDIITQFAGTATYLDYHRGWTHSLIGIPILALMLAALMASFKTPAVPNRSKRFRQHFAVAFIAMSTHPILDWTNTYGVRPFLPFRDKWFYGDLLFVIDPYLDSILLCSLLLSLWIVRRRKLIAMTGLAASLAYVGLLVELRSIARHHFSNYLSQTTGLISTAVCPEFLNPFHWTGFIETATEVSSVVIDARSAEIRPQSRMAKEPESDVTRAAAASYAASVFRGFARFPVTRVKRISSGYRVLFIDLRFYRAPAQTALSAEVLLDQDLRITHDAMSFVMPID